MRTSKALAAVVAPALLVSPAIWAQSKSLAGHLSVPPKGPTRAIVAFYDLNDLTKDQLHLTIGALATWIDTKMAPGDVLGIASAGHPLTVIADFTADKAALHTALDAFDASGVVAPADGTTTFRTMTAVCDDLARVRQKRALLFISSGLNPSSGIAGARDAERICIAANVAITRVDPHALTIR